MIKLVIFDFDGTLFDTHESIEHCIKGTFDHFQPERPADSNEVRRLIGKGTGLYDTFGALQPDPSGYDEKVWEAKYRELYATEGQALIKAFRGVKEVLQELISRSVLTAIVTNKGIMAVHTALENNGLSGLIPEHLIVGDKTPGNVTRKPDIGCYTNVLAPALETHHGLASIDPASILVIGDTEADIQLAKNLGAKSCFARYGYGDLASCLALQPNHVVDELSGVLEIAR